MIQKNKKAISSKQELKEIFFYFEEKKIIFEVFHKSVQFFYFVVLLLWLVISKYYISPLLFIVLLISLLVILFAKIFIFHYLSLPLYSVVTEFERDYTFKIAKEFKDYIEQKGKKGNKEIQNIVKKIKKSNLSLQKFEIISNGLFISCFFFLYIFTFIWLINLIDLLEKPTHLNEITSNFLPIGLIIDLFF